MPKARARIWFITYNNFTKIGKTHLIGWFEKNCKKYIMQEEDEGTPHLQGVVQLKWQKSFDQLKKVNDKIHWEICRDLEAAIEYCSDPEKRKGEIYQFGFPDKLIDPMEGLTEYKWQEAISKILAGKPDNRKIHWVYDCQGNAGKTSYCKSQCMKSKKTLYLGGRATDMKYAITECIQEGLYPDVLLIDVPRTLEGDFSYEGLESIKNGIFFSSKYESKMVMFNIPHVIVFSNWLPIRNMLSIDRWHIIDVDEPPPPP